MTKLNITYKKAGKLSNQIYEQILDWLMSGMLQENDKLPSENELCNSFKVSRPVVRQAITKLQEDKQLSYPKEGTPQGSLCEALHTPPLCKVSDYAK